MSGGHFDYQQYRITDIVEEIESIIKNNIIKNDISYTHTYPESVLLEFKKAVKILKEGAIYTQRIDWLISGDDGVESFHERLKEELERQ